MQDLSLHILDISENSIAAGATKVEIVIDEDTHKNLLSLKIIDNGRGIDKETQKKILDPFYTSKNTRRIGLGLPMLAQSAREAEGDLNIESQIGKGTVVTARFVHDHIDRRPLGDIASTITALLAGKGVEIDVIYRHNRNGDGFIFDTREIKEELQEVPINNPEVLNFLKQKLKEELQNLYG